VSAPAARAVLLAAALLLAPAMRHAPVPLDLRAIDPAVCEPFEQRLVGALCHTAHAARVMGIELVFAPPAGERWGDLVIRAPGIATREISDGTVCFSDIPQGAAQAGAVPRWFSVNTPIGDVLFEWTGEAFARHLVGYAPGCEHA